MAAGQRLVLVVDDDLAVRQSLKFALEQEGLNVHAYAGGAALLAGPDLLRAACLVLVDHMPAMDGFAVLAELRLRRSMLPVILITGHATEALQQRAAAAGVCHVVEKPLLDSALLDSIQHVLART